LHGFTDDPKLGPLLASLLVVPLVELQATLNEYGATFAQVFLGDLGSATPKLHIDERSFLVFFALVVTVDSIHREPNIGDRGALGSILDLGIPGEIPE
jgi:hypothetical protein